MVVISNIDRKIKGFPMWAKGKEYKVLKIERNGNTELILLMDDDNRQHWMGVGKSFRVK